MQSTQNRLEIDRQTALNRLPGRGGSMVVVGDGLGGQAATEKNVTIQNNVGNPTTTTSQKSIAIHLPFVSQYASHLYRSTFGALGSKEREILSVVLPFVSQCASHLYCNTPPIYIAVFLEISWWL